MVCGFRFSTVVTVHMLSKESAPKGRGIQNAPHRRGQAVPPEGAARCDFRFGLEIKTKLLHLTFFFFLKLYVFANHLCIQANGVNAVTP